MIACRNKPADSRGERGFTLLEVLVVVVIFGILISLSTLSITSFSDEDLGEHSRRFSTLINLAIEEAGIQNREYGLHFYQHGYEFAVRVAEVDEDGLPVWVWLPVENDNLFKPRDLGEDVALDLEIEGKEITLEYERDTEEEYFPQIFILSSGDIQPVFNVRIRPAFESTGIMLTVNEFGEVEETYDEF
ncbi:MAG: type II secretion system minor pseudopilin GspH [Gammaproteobacteria bacterium]